MGYIGKVGFCIGENFSRETNPEVFEQMKRIGTPALSDGMRHFNTLDPAIKSIIPNCRIAGQAFTLRLKAADNLMLHKCLGYLKKGDILMIDTCGCRNYSILGELIATAAFKQGIAGMVIDGGIRDICELKAAGFPIFARFVTPAVGDKEGPGEINRLISCGGVPVAPGDYVLADDNGIVVVPKDIVKEVLVSGQKKLESDQKRMLEIQAEAITYIESGDLIPLAVAAPERLNAESVKDVPTCKELGYDVEFGTSRGFAMPGGVDSVVVEYWADLFEQLYNTDEFKQYVQDAGATPAYLGPDEFREANEEQTQKSIEILRYCSQVS